MAIDPSAEYPGQIITGLPGYPLGKAVNVAVSGDGTGTPLEAKWVSDLFGWEQALLDAAGITPSGDPDEVGASDYMDALDALYPAIGRMTTAESDINALEASRVTGPASATDEAFARFDGTTGKLVQDGAVKATNAGAVTGVTDLTLSGEVLYSSPKARVVFVAVQQARATSGWSIGDVGTSSANAAVLFAPLAELPAGCVLTRVRIGVDPGAARAGGSRIQAGITRLIPNTTTGLINNTGYGTATLDNSTGSSQVIEVAYLTANPYTIVSSESVVLTVVAGNDGGAHNADSLQWIELSYLDPGPKNPA